MPTDSNQYPPSLVKSFSDPFDYVLGLRNGETIRFTSAYAKGEFIHLDGAGFGDEMTGDLPFPFRHGLDIRTSEIVWCAEAPEGQ